MQTTRSAALQRAIGQEMQTFMGRVLTESVAVDQTRTGGVLVNGFCLAHGMNKSKCISSLPLFRDNQSIWQIFRPA